MFIVSADFQISPINLMSKLQEVPHKPGIYLMLDRLGRVIYVGKAKDLRKRLSSYFTPSRKIRADIKTRALIDSIWDFDLHTVKNETEALLLEGKLIKEYRPKYNVVFRDDKRFMMLKVNLSDPLPRFQLVRVRKEDGSRYFGPFPHSGALRFTFHWINKQFGLRTCRSRSPGESDYKHCNDDVIRNCTAPCITKVSAETYRENIKEDCRFLDGGWRDRISEIESQMNEASSNREYELAADFRDMIDSLKKILQPTRRFTRGRGIPGSNIDPIADIHIAEDTYDNIFEMGNLVSDAEQAISQLVFSVSGNTNEAAVGASFDGSKLVLSAISDNYNASPAATLTLRVDDGSEVVDAFVDVSIDSVNDSPTVAEYLGANDFNEDEGYLFEIYDFVIEDPDNDALDMVMSVLPGENYDRSLDSPGLVTTAPNFNGNITVHIEIIDGSGGSTVTMVPMVVNPVNDPSFMITTGLNIINNGPATEEQEYILQYPGKIQMVQKMQASMTFL